MQRLCMRQRWFSPFKTLWAVSGTPITGTINLTSPNSGVFCILPYPIYNPQSLISFWRWGVGKDSFPALPQTCCQVGQGETCLSAKLVKSHRSELSSSPAPPKTRERAVHLCTGAASFRIRRMTSGWLQREPVGLPFGHRFRFSPSPSEVSPYFSNHKSVMTRMTECVAMPV